MHFSVIGEHRDYFRKHHLLECEGLLTARQLSSLAKEAENVVSGRLKRPIAKTSADQRFSAGRDLWRSSQALKKLLLQKEMAEVASELLEVKPLRFGFDQYLLGLHSFENGTDVYQRFLNKTSSLEEISSIQGVLCGAMICIQASSTIPKSQPQTENVEPTAVPQPLNVFPTVSGNVCFFAPNVPIDFGVLKSHPDSQYLLLVYVRANAVFHRQDADPHGGEFKRLGYNFGDRLTEQLNPLVYP